MRYKFRAWEEDAGFEDGVDMRLWTWKEMCEMDMQHMFNNPKYELMQFTGLTDVNGVEIYEGDIVKADSEYGESVRDIVCWSYGSFYVSNHTFKQLNNVEVIGNMYQHKHLLKESN